MGILFNSVASEISDNFQQKFEKGSRNIIRFLVNKAPDAYFCVS